MIAQKRLLYFVNICFILFGCSENHDNPKVLESFLKKKGKIIAGGRTLYYHKDIDSWTTEKFIDEETKTFYNKKNKIMKILTELEEKARNGDSLYKFLCAETELKALFMDLLFKGHLVDIHYGARVFETPVFGNPPHIFYKVHNSFRVIEKYEELANHGHIKAQLRLGDLYTFFAKNEDVYNIEKAKQWYQKAANSGNDYALFLLHVISEKNKIDFDYWRTIAGGYGRNWALGRTICYLKDILHNYQYSHIAQFDVKVAGTREYRRTDSGFFVQTKKIRLFNQVPKSKDEIKRLIYTLNKAAASLELEWAYYNLAECYNHGFGCNQDFKKAFYWYKKAAPVLWYFKAAKMLGLYYFDGKGTDKNIVEAEKWLRSAKTIANAGNKDQIIKKIKNFEIKTNIPQPVWSDWKSFTTITDKDKFNIDSILNLIKLQKTKSGCISN